MMYFEFAKAGKTVSMPNPPFDDPAHYYMSGWWFTVMPGGQPTNCIGPPHYQIVSTNPHPPIKKAIYGQPLVDVSTERK